MSSAVHQYGPLRGQPKRGQPKAPTPQTRTAVAQSEPRSYRIFPDGKKWSFTFTDKIHPANTRTYTGFKTKALAADDTKEHRREFKRIEAEINAREKAGL